MHFKLFPKRFVPRSSTLLARKESAESGHNPKRRKIDQSSCFGSTAPLSLADCPVSSTGSFEPPLGTDFPPPSPPSTTASSLSELSSTGESTSEADYLLDWPYESSPTPRQYSIGSFAIADEFIRWEDMRDLIKKDFKYKVYAGDLETFLEVVLGYQRNEWEPIIQKLASDKTLLEIYRSQTKEFFSQQEPFRYGPLLNIRKGILSRIKNKKPVSEWVKNPNTPLEGSRDLKKPDIDIVGVSRNSPQTAKRAPDSRIVWNDVNFWEEVKVVNTAPSSIKSIPPPSTIDSLPINNNFAQALGYGVQAIQSSVGRLWNIGSYVVDGDLSLLCVDAGGAVTTLPTTILPCKRLGQKVDEIETLRTLIRVTIALSYASSTVLGFDPNWDRNLKAAGGSKISSGSYTSKRSTMPSVDGWTRIINDYKFFAEEWVPRPFGFGMLNQGTKVIRGRLVETEQDPNPDRSSFKDSVSRGSASVARMMYIDTSKQTSSGGSKFPSLIHGKPNPHHHASAAPAAISDTSPTSDTSLTSNTSPYDGRKSQAWRDVAPDFAQTRTLPNVEAGSSKLSKGLPNLIQIRTSEAGPSELSQTLDADKPSSSNRRSSRLAAKQGDPVVAKFSWCPTTDISETDLINEAINSGIRGVPTIITSSSGPQLSDLPRAKFLQAMGKPMAPAENRVLATIVTHEYTPFWDPQRFFKTRRNKVEVKAEQQQVGVGEHQMPLEETNEAKGDLKGKKREKQAPPEETDEASQNLRGKKSDKREAKLEREAWKDRDLVSALRKIVVTLQDLFEQAGIIHRDLGITNLCWDEMALVPVIIDFNRAKKMGSGSSSSSPHFRTGIAPFAAIDLLEDDHPIPNQYHDLESLLWIMVWLLAQDQKLRQIEYYSEVKKNELPEEVLTNLKNRWKHFEGECPLLLHIFSGWDIGKLRGQKRIFLSNSTYYPALEDANAGNFPILARLVWALRWEYGASFRAYDADILKRKHPFPQRRPPVPSISHERFLKIWDSTLEAYDREKEVAFEVQDEAGRMEMEGQGGQ